MKKKKLNKQQRELAESWEKLKTANSRPLERGAIAKSVVASSSSTKMPKLTIPSDRDPRILPSVDSGKGSATRKQVQTYSGDAMIGIAQMAKSNAVPVFSTDSVIDITKMRR